MNAFHALDNYFCSIDYITVVKIGVLFAVGISTLLSSLLPWLIQRRLQGRAANLLSTCNCLAGGVVLGCALSHMLPDAESCFRAFFAGSTNTRLQSYPFASLCAAAALLLLFGVDQLLLGSTHSHSHDQFANTTTNTPVPSNPTTPHSHDAHSSSLHALNYSHPQPDISYPQLTESSSLLGNHAHNTEQKTHKSATIFLVALSMHSLFEGLGLGAQQTAKGLYALIFAVVSHKMLEAFALGLSIHNGHFEKSRNALYLVSYALCTPFGIAGGLVAGNYAGSESAELVAGTLTALATGSFLYVSLIEILPQEFEAHTQIKVGKFIVVLFGWLFMAFIAYYC